MLRTKLQTLSIFIIIVLIIELLLRYFGWGDPPVAILDDDIEYYVTPSSTYNRYGNIIKTNRYGMRSRDFDKNDVPTLNISILGDSVVYGNHFLDQKQTIAHILEKELVNFDSEVLVSSIAASSWGPQNIEAFYNLKGPFPGTAAILIQSSHDRYDVITQTISLVPYRTEASFTATSDFVLRVWEYTRDRWFPLEPENPVDVSTELSSITNKSLIKLLRTLKNDYDVVVLFYHKTKTEMLNSGEDTGHIYLSSIASEVGVDFINSQELYSTNTNLNKIYEDDIHLSAEGTDYVAKYLSEWIQMKLNSKK